MASEKPRIAILYPAEAAVRASAMLDSSRYAPTAAALRAAGLEAEGAPYCDEAVAEVRAQLKNVQGVLIWYNPNEHGRDRSVLNAMLSEVAQAGVMVSAHPAVIAKMGTKEVLYLTRGMGWGTDIRLYGSLDAMRSELPTVLSGGPRVLKQIRGQSGDGVWKVELAEMPTAPGAPGHGMTDATTLLVRHAQRGSPEERISLGAFLARCQPYFAATGAMIDQAYQPRLTEGMIRCYLVGDRVAGFGEQLVNMLYPAAPGAPPSEAPLPGPRLYYPPTRADFQQLKEKLEREWVGEMCGLLSLTRDELPVLWDADFMYGPKDASGSDTYVLCEINISSVYPYPESAMAPLAEETARRVRASRS